MGFSVINIYFKGCETDEDIFQSLVIVVFSWKHRIFLKEKENFHISDEDLKSDFYSKLLQCIQFSMFVAY